MACHLIYGSGVVPWGQTDRRLWNEFFQELDPQDILCWTNSRIRNWVKVLYPCKYTEAVCLATVQSFNREVALHNIEHLFLSGHHSYQLWCEELLLLADVAKTKPHAAYAAFIHSFVHKFSYLCRTIGTPLQPLEDCIQSQLIPYANALTDRAPHQL